MTNTKLQDVPVRAKPIPLMALLSRESGESLIDQIVRSVAVRIDDKLLRSGARMPSIRQFATAHGVSPFTVVAGYDNTSASGKKFNFSEKDTELTSLMQRSPEPTFAGGNSASAGMTIQAIPSYGATNNNTAQAPAPLSSTGSTRLSPRNAPLPPVLAPVPAPAPVSLSRNTSNATASTSKATNVIAASNPVMPPRH
eukprot:gene30883-34855_t